MTSLLLDTHAVLWAINEPDRLGASAGDLIRDTSNRLVVSAVSAWELSTKVRLGKLPEAASLMATYAAHLRRLGTEALSITDEHALLAGQLDWEHRDPFDRMLAAQAMVESLTLVTADPALQRLKSIRTVW